MSVILLHGLHQTPEDMQHYAEAISECFGERIRIHIPSGRPIPITAEGGQIFNGWFDVEDRSLHRFKHFSGGLEESMMVVEEVIEHLLNSGIVRSRIIIIGHSQGGALALWCGLSAGVGGVVSIAGFLTGGDRFQLNPKSTTVPILHIHGDSDRRIPLSLAYESRDRIRESGHVGEYRIEELEGVGHSVKDSRVLELVLDFIDSIIS